MTDPSPVAIITGASEGIGFSIARRCADLGYQLVICGRREEPLAAAASDLSAHTQVVAVIGSITDPATVDRCCQAAVEQLGSLDVVVNNAAYVPVQGPVIDSDDDDIEAVWQTNVAAGLRLVRAAWKAAMAERGGVVLNVGSLGGLALQPGMGLYGASKAGLHHLTRILAAELGPAVRVNAIAPGLVRTEGSRVGWEVAEATVIARSPLGRLGEPEDIADAAEFLIGAQSSWITGQVLVVDGGASVQLGRGRPNRQHEREER